MNITNITVISRMFLLWCAAILAWNSSYASTLAADQVNINTNAISQTYPLQVGDYLSTEYIEILKQTRSPVQALKKSDFRQYIVSKLVNNELNFTLMGSFHEGLAGFGVDERGKVSDGYNFKKDFHSITITSASEIVILHRRVKQIVDYAKKKLTYQYVGDIQKFIARNTIAGKYKDEQGKAYAFTEDGQATFPDRAFLYRVRKDYTLSNPDIDDIYEVRPDGKGAERDYGFKFVGDELLLYEMGGPMGTDPELNPFAKLKRITEAETKP